jgi:hypothetical protein
MKQDYEDSGADRELLQFAQTFRQARPALSSEALERVAASMRKEMEKQSFRTAPSISVSYVNFRIAAAAAITVTVALFWMLQREPLKISVAVQTVRRSEIRDTYTVSVPRFPAVKPDAPLLRTDENASLFQ